MKKMFLMCLLTAMMLIGAILSLKGTEPINAEMTEKLKVPEEGMVIVGGTYYGIKKEWYEQVNPNKETIMLEIEIPSTIHTIANDGFRDSYTSDKKKYGAITSNDGGRYQVAEIDFSKAYNLRIINSQAAYGCTELIGVLDFSNTKLETLGKYAFGSCTGITGVILPNTLKEIGNSDGGSVFKGCSSLEFIRTTDSDLDAVFDLPKNLETIGKHAFYGLAGLPDNTEVIIPSSVTSIGSEAFNKTNNITTIIVKTNDASGYHGSAFKNNDMSYGVGGRMVIFNDHDTMDTFKPEGFTSYKNAMTYEYTLYFGTDNSAYSESKLYGQALNVCKKDGKWATDSTYTLPSVSDGTQVGYDKGWSYNNKIVTAKTILKPSGDHLHLQVGYILQDPTIKLMIDGSEIDTNDSYYKLNLSNDSEHVVGVTVSHPIEKIEDSDIEIKFEYQWTDVWRGGSLGPRMQEEGFGRYNQWDKPNVTSTITVYGSEHERTSAGQYSKDDYGDGYYLLEVFGYYCPKSGGQWKLFYKSASTVIGNDPDRTVNTAYLFDVKTSDPASIPLAYIKDQTIEYGYDSVSLKADIDKDDEHTYTYQWYEADKKGQVSGGRVIEGETAEQLQIPQGKEVGEYYYYLKISANKTVNGDTKENVIPAVLKVEPSIIEIIPDANQGKYFGQKDPELTYKITKQERSLAIEGKLGRQEGEKIGSYNYTLGTLKSLNPNYVLKLNDNEEIFYIERYMIQADLSPEEPNGYNGWYRTEVIISPPDEHLISFDERKTWSAEPLVLKDMDGRIDYLLRSDKNDDTNGAIADHYFELRIDTVYPKIEGIEHNQTYIDEVEFTVDDQNLQDIIIDGTRFEIEDTFHLEAGRHVITVQDEAGNAISINVTVAGRDQTIEIPSTGDDGYGLLILLALMAVGLAISGYGSVGKKQR